jgi:hypothetical protein
MQYYYLQTHQQLFNSIPLFLSSSDHSSSTLLSFTSTTIMSPTKRRQEQHLKQQLQSDDNDQVLPIHHAIQIKTI